MIVITGATGRLGRLVIAKLLAAGVPADDVVAAARTPERAADLAERGVRVRHADYDKPESVATALAGADAVLLVSAPDPTRAREEQHRAVIDAAVDAKVGLLAYTSILGGDRATLRLADAHRATEALVRESGLDHVMLRNGWYTENYTEHLAVALEHGAIVRSASPEARVASAAIEEYAEAAAAVLTAKETDRRSVYELSGDTAWTMAGLAEEVSRQAGRTVEYRQVSPEEHRAILVGAGVPGAVADLLVDSDAATDRGELAATPGELSRLIGRATAPLADAVAAAIRP
ncbi:NAD(P)H-binding protein [Pseudonocardia acaciae]|uniref:NAD(P)H-binding protein n=1 Tax=Pseudonocardia acaciae TaxID=551276 RepID=UPI0005614516|nr:NAD(P)H-binding protein [Pseudonocardia acaciae]